MALNLVDQVLWSQRFGEHLGGDWSLGETIGIPNTATYKAFLGVTRSGDGSNYQDLFGTEFNGLREFLDFNTGDLGFPPLASVYANGSAGIASANNRNQNATIKAGLELETGYNLGEVKWNLPLYADLLLEIDDGKLDFDLNTDLKDAFFDYTSPYLYLYATGIFNTDAALYLDGSVGAKYVDVINTVGDTVGNWLRGNFKTTVREESKSWDFHEKLNLSTNLNHRFVDFDTRKDKQVVDWMFGKKVFETGNITDKFESIDLGNWFDLGFTLPDFSDVDFTRLTSINGLLNSNNLNFDFQDSYVYSIADDFEVFNFTYDIDQFISSFLPIPISFEHEKSFSLFGKNFGYDAAISLLDIDLELSLKLGYQIDLGITDLTPTIQVEDSNSHDGWTNFNYNDPNLDFSSLANYDANGNSDGILNLKVGFDPNVFINVNTYVQPEIKLRTGIGEYKLDINPGILSLGGDNQYLIDTPDLDLFNGQKYYLLEESWQQSLSDLININSIASIPISIPLTPIADAIGENYYLGTDNADYYKGTDKDDTIIFKGGSDVGQLSLGVDDINGGSSGNEQKVTSYYDPFGFPISQFTTLAGDVFILDSDIYSSGNNISLFSEGYDSTQYYQLALGESKNSNNQTSLREVERILFSDELQASTDGINMNFFELDEGLGDQFPYLYIGGFHADVYATDLPIGSLTGTNGNDYLGVPTGYNRTAPYALGKGDDTFISEESIRIDGNYSLVNGLIWHNPYYDYNERNSHIYNDDQSGHFYKIYDDDPETLIYQDIIDLGSGSNNIDFFGRPQKDKYDVFVSSVNLGGINTIRLSAPDLLRLINIGGSVNLDQLDYSNHTGIIYGILGAGNNSLVFEKGNPIDAELTFVLESEGLKNKLALTDLPEINVELSGTDIYYSAQGKTVSDKLYPFPEYSGINSEIIIASADLAGDSIRQELGSESRYSLQSPSRQTFILGNTDLTDVTIRGRTLAQTNAYREIIITDNFSSHPLENKRIDLGLDSNFERDFFDKLTFEGFPDQENDILRLIINGDFNTIDFSPTTNNNFQIGISSLPRYINKTTFGDQIDEVQIYQIFSMGSEGETLVSTGLNSSIKKNYVDFENLGAKTTAQEKQELLEMIKYQPKPLPFDPSSLPKNFEDTAFFNYIPMTSHFLEDGDDMFSSSSLNYEFIYPGGGNNLIGKDKSIGEDNFKSISFGLNHITRNIEIIGAEGDEAYLYDPENDIFTVGILGDVVVYTEGNSYEYIIQKSADYGGIEVTKPNGTVDLLWGISLIKFETEDVQPILVPNEVAINAEPILDPFGNDITSRLFYSRTVNEDGEVGYTQLANQWAVDRVDLTQSQVYQPGKTLANWQDTIPIGLTEFNLTKEFLAKEFFDPDIDHKNLYDLQDLAITDLIITQDGQILNANLQSNGNWNISLNQAIDINSSPFEVEYIITEPEGYSHLVNLQLTANQKQDLAQLKNTFQSGILSEDFSADDMDNYIEGTEEADTIFGNAGNDNIYGNGGNDKLNGGVGNDFISGGDGDDMIIGGEGDDILQGGNGNDTLRDDSGFNILRGGLGNDSYILAARSTQGNLIQDEGGVDSLELTDLDLASEIANNTISFLKLDNTTLVIDINGDQIINIDVDIAIIDFFSTDGSGAGSGFIEIVDGISGNEILGMNLKQVSLNLLTALDIDMDGKINMLTDGLLFLGGTYYYENIEDKTQRDSLMTSFINTIPFSDQATRKTPEQIIDLFEKNLSNLDFDGNAKADFLTDGLLFLGSAYYTNEGGILNETLMTNFMNTINFSDQATRKDFSSVSNFLETVAWII